MQKLFMLFSFLLMNQFLFAQSGPWINYANDFIAWDVLPTNEYVWVSTQGGLVRIDRNTGQRKIFQPWNSGLRGTDVSAVNLAPDGKMWVSGSQGGLFRFDGAEAWDQFYDINTGTALVQILELEVTPDGKLWFISNVNGSCSGCTKVFHFDGVNFSEHQDAIIPAVGSTYVRKLSLDITGKLWATNGLKIVQYDGGISTDAAIPLLANESITDMGFDQQNTLWVGTYQYFSGSQDYVYRIRYFDGNSWSELNEATIGGDILPVEKMLKDTSGNFYIPFSPWYGESYAFAKYDGNAWEYTKISAMPGSAPALNSTLKAVDSQGHLWFQGYLDAHSPMIYEFDGQNWKSYNTEIYPLVSNYVEDVAFDCERNTWFGGHDMLTKFDGVSWRDYTMQDMGFNTDYFSIASLTVDTSKCDLWITFNQNTTDPIGFAKFDGSTFTTYSTPVGYSTHEIAISKDGTVWVAAPGSGLGKFDGSTWTWYNEQNSPISDYVYSVAIDHEQNVWISTNYESTIARWDGTSWLIFDETNSPVSGYSNWVFVDHAGMIWTSNAEGLLRFNGAAWQAFPVPGTLSQGVYRMTQDQEYNFWLSNRAGVHQWDGSAFESYNFIDQPLASGFVWRTRIDPFGNKWFVHNGVGGVTVFNENGISNQIINPTAKVRGSVFYDGNQDGQQGPASVEPGIPNEKVYLQPNNTAIFTGFSGEYTLFPPPGNYQLNYMGSEEYTPTTTQSLPLIMGTNEQSGFNYGAWSENPQDSISLDLTAGNMRCNEAVNVRLSLVSYGLLEAAGDITLLFDPALTFLSASPQPDMVQGNLLTWHYTGLSLYELMQFNAVFKVPGPDSIGQILSLQSDATVLEDNIVTASAGMDERAEVRCSFDPNDKSSASEGPSKDQYSLLNDALDFTIRFQNSGNDTAFTVILRDTLDANLNFSSLQIVSSSHAVRTSLTSDGVLTFVFDNIDLLWESIDYAGSQGFVKYRIAPRADLPDPTVVRNTAHIFFDFNPAIVTNTTINVLVETLPSTGTAEIAKPIGVARLYPNPNKGDFWIEWLDENPIQTWQISVVDMLGRICFQSSAEQKMLQVTDLSPGFYFVFLEKDGKVECHKLVVTQD